MKLLFASHNEFKVQEIRDLLPSGFELLGLNDLGLLSEIEETANTFEGNALIKAKTAFLSTQIPSFSDDSGLEVEALDGAPGVFSARYAGPEKNDEANCHKLLLDLDSFQNRTARFRTVIAFVTNNEERFFHGSIEGKIVKEPKGSHGFGYDPIFQPLGWDKTFAQVDKTTKNKVSHRAIAFQEFLNFLATVNKI